MNIMLKRSVVAKSAKSVFFQDINDIDIFVEDTASGYEKLLATIFSRTLHKKYRVKKVFPLGSRKEVVKHYKEKIHIIKRPTLFIVDGDLFILKGDDISNERGLYRFPFYCFENLICQEQAILDILNEEDSVLYRDQISEKFDYSNWEKQNIDLLFDLFVMYATVMILKPTIQTVAYGVKPFMIDNLGNISAEKLKEREVSLRTVLTEEFGEQTVSETIDSVLTRFSQLGQRKIDVISGKDYIFPLLKTRARSSVSTKMSDINFKLRLTNKVDLDSIKDCKNYIAVPV